MVRPRMLGAAVLLLQLLSLTRCGARRIVVSIDVGTESTRAAVFDASGSCLGSSSCPHATQHPAAGWAEQRPEDWWHGMGEAIRGALAESRGDPSEVAALCIATTSCTVLACDASGVPLRPALLWMDARSAPQAAEILERGAGDEALRVNCEGMGPLSAEWMLCKALWLKQEQPELWAKAAYVCECQDWLQYRCTGRIVAGGCNVATRWHCDGVEATRTPRPAEGGFGGRPLSLLSRVGLDDLPEKWPSECVAMGERMGELTTEAAEHLGLRAGTPVAQGGADAYVGLVGLGAATTPRAVGLITGSSHLHLAVVDAAEPKTSRGVWGAYRGAPLAHLAMAEGGQSSTGAALQWARRLFSPPRAAADGAGGGEGGGEGVALQTLDEEAAEVAIGCEGLCALETFQGSRTPVTDPLARGALIGLTLRHTRGHVWRALLEAVCLGTRAALDGLEEATGSRPDVLLAAGGAARSPLWLQMHADACNLPVVLLDGGSEAPLLGAAVLAAALPGSLHGEEVSNEEPGAPGDEPPAASASPAAIGRAVGAMVRHGARIDPDPERAAQYEALYRSRYMHIAPTVAPLSHRAALAPAAQPRRRRAPGQPLVMPRSGRAALIEPSVLAADLGSLSAAAREVFAAGATWVHVDVCDGSIEASRALSSLGPASIRAVRDAAPELLIDVHLYTRDPEAHFASMAAAGADRITFQMEMMGALDSPDALARAQARASELAHSIRAAGCRVGVCIAPSTPAEVVGPLCDAGEVDLVDVLAVLPGIGGQPFQPPALDKVRALRARHPDLPYLLVDGGIDAATAPLVAAAGANALVSGSYLFRAPLGQMAGRLEALELALLEHGD